MAKREGEPQVELESQFILRLPSEPSAVLRELIRSGSTSLKDRFSIKLENDVRYGEVRLDNWYLNAKVYDLPTILESLKTIDNKSFYKTADICQIMICKEEDDQTTTDEESPSKHKKKDPNKVDKKFLWPHGITPPLKNVRKRRFRKTLKKKYVEAPEIEKEVKRLLRGDSEAVSVRWDVITEEEEVNVKKEVVIKEEEEVEDPLVPTPSNMSNSQTVDVAEHEIFGEAVSDSEEEEPSINIMDIEESSRLSADDSRMSDTASFHGTEMSDAQSSGTGHMGSTSGSQLITQFSKEMFRPGPSGSSSRIEDYTSFSADYSSQSISEFKKDDDSPPPSSPSQMSHDDIRRRIEHLQRDINDLKVRRQQHEAEVAHIENHALRQRFQNILEALLQEQFEKEHEFQSLSLLLNDTH